MPLPELKPAKGAADVTIRLESIGWRPVETDEYGYSMALTADEAYIFWEDMGAVLVREGREIVIDPAPGVLDRVIRLCILGLPLAVLLHQRGLPVFHASTVAVAGEAVSFLGAQGWGKSTMAAALHIQGYPMMTDDITAVWVDGERRPVVYPGFPQFKLFPESVTMLGENPDELPLLDPDFFDKRARRAEEGFSLEPLPLGCIYVLAEGEIPEITPLWPQEAMAELIGHSFGTEALRSAIALSRFSQYANIIRNAPIRRLKIPDSLLDLPDLARLVEKDIAG